jgi:hypothetical protein
MRHLQKQQIGKLLQVIAVAHPIIAQGVAEIPDFLDEGRGVQKTGISISVGEQIELWRSIEGRFKAFIKYPSNKLKSISH